MELIIMRQLRRRQNRIAGATMDFIYDIVWTGDTLAQIRQRLLEVANDDNLWGELEQHNQISKGLDNKLTRLMNKKKAGR